MEHFLLGFDVGTKNLAYCLSKYTDDNKKINNNEKKINDDEKKKINLLNLNILDWNIIDIHRVRLSCKQIKNKRAICNKKCHDYILKNNSDDHSDQNNIEGYCQDHVKKLRENNKKIEKQNKQIEKQNKQNKKLNIKNIIVNDDDDDDNNNKIVKIHKVKNNAIFADCLNTTAEKLIAKLDDLFTKFMLGYNYDIKTKKISKIKKLRVVIENQPTKRQSMNNIAMMIYTFFHMKKRMYPNIVEAVNFVHAKSKTKKEFVTDIYHTFGIKSSINEFIEYGKRKTFAEEIIRKLIFKIKDNDVNTLINMGVFLVRKKKDDLADALLFVLYACFYHI